MLTGLKNMKISIITLVNNSNIYEENVMKSTSTKKDNIEYIKIYNPSSASKGLNIGIDTATNDILIACHQDVYFLDRWYEILQELLDDKINKINNNWGVCGMAGTTFDGKMVGTHSGLNMSGNIIIPVQTLDCSCLVLKKSNNLRFDENLKYFHMYGEDIALQANDKGLDAYVIDVPINHRTNWTAGSGFVESGDYIGRKWHHKFGIIYTTVGTH